MGIASIRRDLPATATQAEVEAVMDELNADPACTGVPGAAAAARRGLDEQRVLARRRPGARTSTGCTRPTSAGWCSARRRRCRARPPASSSCCAATTCRSPAPTSVIVGRGITVGRPLGLMLTRRSENATVTLCHTGTRDLAAHVRRADIVVAAAGRAGSDHRRHGQAGRGRARRRRQPGRRQDRRRRRRGRRRGGRLAAPRTPAGSGR